MTSNSASPRTALFHLTALAGLMAILTFAPLSASALGLGSIRVSSPAGQPLRAEVDLLVDNRREAKDMVVRNGSADEYRRQGLGPRGALAGLRIAIEPRGSKWVGVLTTREALNDPYAYIVLEGSSGNGRVMRSYAVLLRVDALSPSATRKSSAEHSLQGPVSANSFPEEAKPDARRLARPVVEDASTRLYEHLIEIGKRPAGKQLSRVSGRGRQEPVGQALFRIVPKGWKGFAGEVDVRSMPAIDWFAQNDYWIHVLDDVMAKTALTATVNWPAKEVTFRSLDLPAQASIVATPPSQEAVRAVVRPAPEVIATPVEVSPARDVAREPAAESQAPSHAAHPAALSAPTAPSVSPVVQTSAPVTPEKVLVQAGGLSLDTVIRMVMPSDHLLLANDQKALQRPRVKAPQGNADWLATVTALVTSQGGTVRFDHEKKRIFVSLTS